MFKYTCKIAATCVVEVGEVNDVHYEILGPFYAARPASYRPEAGQDNLLSGWEKSARQRAESDAVEVRIKAFRWLVSLSFGKGDKEVKNKKVDDVQRARRTHFAKNHSRRLCNLPK